MNMSDSSSYYNFAETQQDWILFLNYLITINIMKVHPFDFNFEEIAD